MEAGNLVRTKAPRTQCEDQEAVFWTVGRLVERADVLGGETRRIGIVIGIVRPVELLVEAISWVDDGPFAPDQMSVPVRDDEVNPAFGLTAIELVVETVERCPARVDRLICRDIATAIDGRHEVVCVVLVAVGSDLAIQSVAERID